MATATVSPGIPLPAGRPDVRAFAEMMLELIPGRSVSITGIDWTDYEYIRGVRDANRRTVRMWYDQGRLEVMGTTNVHEVWKSVLAALIVCYAEETGRQLVGCGSMTIDSRDLDRGFIPDECYYIQSVVRVLPLRRLDFTRDPPPDLTIEIEFTRSAVDRLGVYAAFRVPEVWRYDGVALTVLHLQPDGTYQARDDSLAFPDLPVDELVRFVRMADALDLASIVRQFRAWVRQTLTPPAAGPTP